MPEEKTVDGQILDRLKTIEAAILKLNDKIEHQSSRISLLEGDNPVGNMEKVEKSVPAYEAKPMNYQSEKAKLSFENSKGSEKKSESLEENIGGKWFARIGVAVIVLGISIFLKYAFDNDWIGEAGRVALGIFAGIALLAVGEKTIRKYSVWGQVVSGGGISVLYLSMFSAFGFYDLIGEFTAFFFMTIITIIGVALGLRYDALSLMVVSTVGGFVTPWMLGFDYQSILFTYYALLDLAILAISVFKRWHSLNAVGFAFTVLSFLIWADGNYTDKMLFSTFMYMTLFFGIYSISSVIYNIVKKEVSTGVEQIMSILVAFVYFFGSYALLRDDYEFALGFFALILAIYYYLFAYSTRIFTPQDRNLYNFLALLAVGFITLAIPLQFNQNIITIAWLTEAVLLLVLGLKINRSSVVKISTAVFGLAIFRFFILDATTSGAGNMLLFNKFFFTALMVIAAMYVSAIIIGNIFEESEEFKGMSRKALMGVFLILANFVTIYSISREIIVHYDNRINAISDRQYESMRMPSSSGRPFVNNRQSVQQEENYYKQMESLENRSSISLSIFWLIYSIILIAFGMLMKSKGARVGGLLLLTLSILKLFFYDLWSLGTVYRIMSSISLGMVLLAISFAYQKYKEKIKEII